MSITRSEVLHLAKLARLRLPDEEIAGLEKDLNAILAYFDQLQQVDVTGVEPMVHAVEGSNLLEDDVPHDCLSRDVALRDAPDRTAEFFRLPRVLG
ncbi:MAG: Asp-tRNA(Asn)/Glu-tRNA(Gln) amidotransferase subunit GatC [bacterium]|nr:Asp-tRNA(Asn)/Glu-tRNA(Gln) amidotransferase subunit GatC [bacterium]MBK8130000.1 Asp-tRNA(Asn)/Glu-tRNA(Gln) amidotransferase subunit GatC [bacterium]